MKKIIIYFLIFIATAALVLTISLKVASAPISFNLFEKAKETVLPPPEITLPIASSATTTLMFGGDVMLSRVVNQQSVKYQDWSWPFRLVAAFLADNDLAIVNLESPFTNGGNHLVKTGSFAFNADPNSLAGLKLAGVDIVSLANNHILNQGQKGITDTRKLLTDSNIAFVGAGNNEAQARTPVIKEISGAKIAFLAYAYPDDNSVAGTTTAGLANMDISKMRRDINDLKPQVDLIVVLMHAGIEYTNQPSEQQKQFAHNAVEAGADLVIGHHPHWVQTTEIYQGRPILYSLGNLVFDQMWSKETTEGALAKIIVKDKKITTIEIIPIIIKDYGQAKIADGQTKLDILKRMQLASSTIIINE